MTTYIDHEQDTSDGHQNGILPVNLPNGALIGGGIAAALAGAAWFNHHAKVKAEEKTPPEGRFVEVDGVRLHYVERGEGRPLVLLHGNGAMLQDMIASGILAGAARKFRVIAFDRPGYGYSTRPGFRAWTPREQGDLFATAFAALGIERPIVLGHSWGTMVALAIALDHRESVSALVLASGYYPTARPDFLQQLPTAAPVLGDALSHTVVPLVARAMGALQVKLAFSPAPVAETFSHLPAGLALRPSHLRTSAIEGALMLPGVSAISGRYGELRLPVELIAGEGDKVAFATRHSAQLHRELASSNLRIVPDVGHMIHYTVPDEVLAAIDRAAERSA